MFQIPPFVFRFSLIVSLTVNICICKEIQSDNNRPTENNDIQVNDNKNVFSQLRWKLVGEKLHFWKQKLFNRRAANEAQAERNKTGTLSLLKASQDDDDGIQLFSIHWRKVAAYFMTGIFIILAAIVKIVYHHTHALNTLIPESCALIALGTAAGVFIYFVKAIQEYIPAFTSELFLYILLPPIVLESAFSLHDHIFFFNIMTIMLYAVIGTIMNVALLAPALNICGRFNVFGEAKISLIECVMFSTLISAVDPVAVLAIFQEVNVNKGLYFLVFGESLFNDAVVIVLYNSLSSFAAAEFVAATQIFAAFLSFFIVSGGGLVVGILFGVASALITRFTTDVRVVEPLIIVTLAYLSYICAELFHFSGIIGMITCGLMQWEYCMSNVSRKSRTTIKYMTKTLSSVSDTIIFLYLGRVLVRSDHSWNTSFIVISTALCIVFRFFTVFALTYLANNLFQRVRPIDFEEQLLMSYGGLRGAIAFCLSIVLDDQAIEQVKMFITTTLFIILFTVYVLGSTTKPIVRYLRIQIQAKQESKLFLALNHKVMETVMICIEEISGQRSLNYWMQKFSHFNHKYVRRYLVASPEDTPTSIKIAYDKTYYKNSKESRTETEASKTEGQLDTPEKDIYPDINEPLEVGNFVDDRGFFKTAMGDTLREISRKETTSENGHYTVIEEVDRVGCVPFPRSRKILLLLLETEESRVRIEPSSQVHRTGVVHKWETSIGETPLLLVSKKAPALPSPAQRLAPKKNDEDLTRKLDEAFSMSEYYRLPRLRTEHQELKKPKAQVKSPVQKKTGPSMLLLRSEQGSRKSVKTVQKGPKINKNK